MLTNPTTRPEREYHPPRTSVSDLMDSLLAEGDMEASVEAAVARQFERIDTGEAVATTLHRLGALDVTGEAFPADYAGIDDLTLAVTR